MTKDQEHLVTMLFIKYGGFEKVVDLWLYTDDRLSESEMEAVEKFLEDDRQNKPLDAKLQNTEAYPYISLKLMINSSEKDWSLLRPLLYFMYY